MTKPIALVLLGCCVLLAGCRQSSPSASSEVIKPAGEPASVLLPVKVSGKWGYVNGSGKLVINPQFDGANNFQEGRAAVCLGKPCGWWDSPGGDSRWGYIDEAGKIVVTPQYEAAADFSEGLASVCTGECSGTDPQKAATRGYIDREGKVIIPMQFGIASSFTEGLAQVCIGVCSWNKDSGGYSGKFGFIDHSGHFVVNPIYDNVFDFKNGFARVTIGKGDDAKSGYINKAENVIWQPSN